MAIRLFGGSFEEEDVRVCTGSTWRAAIARGHRAHVDKRTKLRRICHPYQEGFLPGLRDFGIQNKVSPLGPVTPPSFDGRAYKRE